MTAKKPDLTVILRKPLAIDFSYVTPQKTPGAAAKSASRDKINKHAAAVRLSGHDFAPFVGEDGGHHDNSCVDTVRRICEELPIWQKKLMEQELWCAVSTAFQRELVSTFQSAMGLNRARNVERW